MSELSNASCGVLHEEQLTNILRIYSDSVRGSPVVSFGEKAFHLPRPLNLFGLGLFVKCRTQRKEATPSSGISS
jgi:hypothetical protein